MEIPKPPVREESTKPAVQPAAMDIMPPKVAEAPSAPQPATSAKPAHPAPRPHITHSPKQPGSGMGLVVFATVVIVLGLGTLMVYAYLRTNGVNIL